MNNDSRYDPTHHHYGLRTPLSLALSSDRGATWTKVADLAHHEEFNFTNLGCDFINRVQAIVSYCTWGPQSGLKPATDSEKSPQRLGIQCLRVLFTTDQKSRTTLCH